MLQTNANLPLVSFVIAAYNAEKDISLCLSSIRRQAYPKDAIEIIVIDGGSSDKTIEIAKAFGAKVVDNPYRIAEFAKSIGIQNAVGKYTVILDTDNEIAQSDWLERNIHALEDDSSLLGMDTQFLVRGGDYLVNRYCALLTTEDPFVRYLATVEKNSFSQEKNGYSVHVVKPRRFPIFGSNGFIWRKSVLEAVGSYKPRFDEADFCVQAVEKGYSHIGFIRGYGVYHHHLTSVAEFLEKRFRRGREFMSRKIHPDKERPSTRTVWLDKYSKLEIAIAILLCISIIYPAYEAIRGYLKDRDWAWFLHPFLSALTIIAYGISFLRFMIWQ